MKRLLLLSALLAALTAASADWQPDILGDGFEMTYVDQGKDYSGLVRSSVVRLESPCANGRGVLYVHGFNDYFFQEEMARRFADSCYVFFAVDLRKYGRSLMEGQTPFEVRDVKEYFADIDSAISLMKADGIDDIVLMGHSTGGLTCSLYMSEQPDSAVKALVLNSPFLDWNQSKLQEKLLIPAVDLLAPLTPRKKIAQGGSDGYARSLLKQYGGEWDYNTDWKMVHSPDVELSWLRAIDNAHAVVQRDPHVMVPVLLMHSDRSFRPGDPDSDYGHTDAVLDVDDISRYGRRLGPDVTELTVHGGLHDLVLSRPEVREPLYDAMFRWISPRVGADSRR